MGTYTTIYDRERDVQIQIKGCPWGSDTCNSYDIGEELDWWVDENHVGQHHLLDGLYVGRVIEEERVNGLSRAWVVIGDHKPVTVVYVDECSSETAQDLQFTHNPLRHVETDPRYRALFTEKAWEQYHERDAQAEAEVKAYMAQLPEDASDEDRQKHAVIGLLRAMLGCGLNYQAIGKSMIVVVEVPPSL